MKPYQSALAVISALTLGALVTSCGERFANKTVTWKLQSQATQTSLDFKQLEIMAERIRVMSAGRFILEVHSAGEIVPGPDIFRAVSEGRVQMGNGWPNWWSAQNPAWAVMNAGPFDFMGLDASMMFFIAGPGTELANELSAPKGVLWRPAWWPGMEFGLLSPEPLRGLDDLKGKKIRIGPGLPAEVLAEASGASTIPLVPLEIRPALESGQIDAVEWTTASGVWDLGLHDVAKHALVPAIWQPSVLSDFLIQQSAYDALPADLQAILESAIQSYTLVTTFKNKVADMDAMDRFIDINLQFHRWSDDDILRWRQANDTIISNYKKQNDFSRRFIERKQDFKKRYQAYGEYFAPYDQ